MGLVWFQSKGNATLWLSFQQRCRHINALQTLWYFLLCTSVYVCTVSYARAKDYFPFSGNDQAINLLSVHFYIPAYREHRRGEETPCKKFQEDDHHSMVNTGLTNSLRLNGNRKTHTHTQRQRLKWVRSTKEVSMHHLLYVNGNTKTDPTLNWNLLPGSWLTSFLLFNFYQTADCPIWEILSEALYCWMNQVTNHIPDSFFFF